MHFVMKRPIDIGMTKLRHPRPLKGHQCRVSCIAWWRIVARISAWRCATCASARHGRRGIRISLSSINHKASQFSQHASASGILRRIESPRIKVILQRRTRTIYNFSEHRISYRYQFRCIAMSSLNYRSVITRRNGRWKSVIQLSIRV